jgi:hypothetical protein
VGGTRPASSAPSSIIASEKRTLTSTASSTGPSGARRSTRSGPAPAAGRDGGPFAARGGNGSDSLRVGAGGRAESGRSAKASATGALAIGGSRASSASRCRVSSGSARTGRRALGTRSTSLSRKPSPFVDSCQTTRCSGGRADGAGGAAVTGGLGPGQPPTMPPAITVARSNITRRTRRRANREPSRSAPTRPMTASSHATVRATTNADRAHGSHSPFAALGARTLIRAGSEDRVPRGDTGAAPATGFVSTPPGAAR